MLTLLSFSTEHKPPVSICKASLVLAAGREERSRNGELDFGVRDVMNRSVALVAVISLGCLAAAAQTKPGFEAVSIKFVPTPTPATMMNWRPVYNLDANRVEIRNYPLLLVLVRAFEVQLEQIIAPDFARDQYFDIQATLSEGATKELGEASHESFRNMLEAAGLKLEMRKVPKETIVVDHIEQVPTEN